MLKLTSKTNNNEKEDFLNILSSINQRNLVHSGENGISEYLAKRIKIRMSLKAQYSNTRPKSKPKKKEIGTKDNLLFKSKKSETEINREKKRGKDNQLKMEEWLEECTTLAVIIEREPFRFGGRMQKYDFPSKREKMLAKSNH